MWKNQDQFDSLVTELKPKNNEPRDGVRAVSAKRKGLAEQEEEKRLERRMRQNKKRWKRLEEQFEAAAAARA